MIARLTRLGALVRRFSRARRGSAAIEFAVVVLPFFLLTFGMAEVSMMGFAQASLDSAVSETARQIRTGEAQTQNLSYSTLKTQLCTNLNRFLVLGCSNNLYLDVDQFVSFVDADNGEVNPVQDDKFDASGFGYNPGGPSNIVVVRAYYRWQIMTPLFEPVFQNISGGQRILVSTMMFRNEPYQ